MTEYSSNREQIVFLRSYYETKGVLDKAQGEMEVKTTHA